MGWVTYGSSRLILIGLGLLDLILWLSDPTNHTFEAGWAPQPRDLLGGRKVGIERSHALQKKAEMVAVRRRKRKALDDGKTLASASGAASSERARERASRASSHAL